jgi:hypothetical protein
MNLLDLTPGQLKRAAAIKEQIERLNNELRGILGVSTNSGPISRKGRSMSAAVKKKIAAAQKARWVNLRRAKSATHSAKRTATAKRKVSSATRAKLAAKLKAYWAAKKSSRK